MRRLVLAIIAAAIITWGAIYGYQVFCQCKTVFDKYTIEKMRK